MQLTVCHRAPALLRQSVLAHTLRAIQSMHLQDKWELFPTAHRRHPQAARAAGRGDQTETGTEIEMADVEIETEIGTVIAQRIDGLQQLWGRLFSVLQCRRRHFQQFPPKVSRSD